MLAPRDIEIVLEPGHTGPPLFRENVINLRFGVEEGWSALVILRSNFEHSDYEQIARLEGERLRTLWYHDEDVHRGRTYWYRFVAYGPDGGRSRTSRAISARFGVPATYPGGPIAINNNAVLTDSLDVFLTFPGSDAASSAPRGDRSAVARQSAPSTAIPSR